MFKDQTLDMDLVRNILIGVSKGDFSIFETADRQRMMYHLWAMDNGELIERQVVMENGYTPPQMIIITWAGQEFLKNATSDTVWGKAKKRAGAVGGQLSIELMKALLVDTVKRELGLKTD